MVIGYGILTFRLHGCHSLKEKRSVVKSLIRRTQNQFNVSIAEVADNDMLQTARIGFSLVGNNQRRINSQMDKLLEFTDGWDSAEMVDSELEIMML